MPLDLAYGIGEPVKLPVCEYTLHLKKGLEDVYQNVRSQLIKAMNIERNIMTKPLTEKIIQLVKLFGCTLLLSHMGDPGSFTTLGLTHSK